MDSRVKKRARAGEGVKLSAMAGPSRVVEKESDSLDKARAKASSPVSSLVSSELGSRLVPLLARNSAELSSKFVTPRDLRCPTSKTTRVLKRASSATRFEVNVPSRKRKVEAKRLRCDVRR